MSIQPGELIVAHLKQGLTLVRAIEVGTTQITISLGRNKQARLPHRRILYATNLVTDSDRETEELQLASQAISDKLNVNELWQLVKDEADEFTLEDLARIHWTGNPTLPQKIGLLFHLEKFPVYFSRDKNIYWPASIENIEIIRSQKRKDEERSASRSTLMEHLTYGKVPSPMNEHHKALLAHLREFAIHGDTYSKRRVAKDLLEYTGQVSREPQRQAFRLLENANILSADDPIELEQYSIPTKFPHQVLREAKRISREQFTDDVNRVDLTSLDTFTIDDALTTDRDDALSCESLPNGQGHEIGVHITDVAGLVPRNGAIDTEANRRMATVYLPESKISMLPSEIEHEKGSLDPDKLRHCLTLFIQISEIGEIQDWRIDRSTIVSKAALTYDEVDGLIENSSGLRHDKLSTLHHLMQLIRQRRQEAGAMSLNPAELIVNVAPQNEVSVRVVERGSAARLLVAEVMVLHNTLLAEFCAENKLSVIYRTQKSPWTSESPERSISPDVQNVAYDHYLITKGMPPAASGTVPEPHSGLGVKAYVQVSSPLRRYPDLVLQRQISCFLTTGEAAHTAKEIGLLAGHTDTQLRQLAFISENRKRYWFLKYLSLKYLKYGTHDFAAVTLDTDRRGPSLLQLVDYPYRVRAELPPACQPGDPLVLRLHSVDLWRRVGHFIYVGPTTLSI